MSSDPVCQPSGPAEVHWFGAPLVQMNKDVHVVSKVWLSSNQNNGRGRVAGTDLWDPFGGDVVKGDRVDQAEAEDEDIHVGIAQRAEMAKLLLTDHMMRDEKQRTKTALLKKSKCDVEYLPAQLYLSVWYELGCHSREPNLENE